MRRLVVAFGFLTRLPMPNVAADSADFAAAIRWYPAVGFAIGAIVAATAWTGALLDPWVGALAGLVAWVAVTGALHLDGLGDLADGLGAAHRDRTRLLAVMADPGVGSFGVVAIALQLLAKLVLLHVSVRSPWAIAMIPFAARIGPLAWGRWLRPLRTGLGSAVASAARQRDVMGWTVVLAGMCVVMPCLVAAPLLILCFGLWLKWRVGGVTGDCHGAGIEAVESGLLLALVVAGRL